MVLIIKLSPYYIHIFDVSENIEKKVPNDKFQTAIWFFLNTQFFLYCEEYIQIYLLHTDLHKCGSRIIVAMNVNQWNRVF